MKLKVDRIIWIGGITLIGFPVLAFLLLLVFSNGWNSFLEMFNSETALILEVVYGIGCGGFAGASAWLIIQSKWMRPILIKYGDLVQNLKLSLFQIIFLSICAGAGEEIFFRGALQPFWGVWITAIVFVAIHGYLNFKDIRIFVYGSFMTVVIAALGWMTKEIGLISAIVAHTVIDIVLFYNLTHTSILKKQNIFDKEELWDFEEE